MQAQYNDSVYQVVWKAILCTCQMFITWVYPVEFHSRLSFIAKSQRIFNIAELEFVQWSELIRFSHLCLSDWAFDAWRFLHSKYILFKRMCTYANVWCSTQTFFRRFWLSSYIRLHMLFVVRDTRTRQSIFAFDIHLHNLQCFPIVPLWFVYIFFLLFCDVNGFAFRFLLLLSNMNIAPVCNGYWNKNLRFLSTNLFHSTLRTLFAFHYSFMCIVHMRTCCTYMKCSNFLRLNFVARSYVSHFVFSCLYSLLSRCLLLKFRSLLVFRNLLGTIRFWI